MFMIVLLYFLVKISQSLPLSFDTILRLYLRIYRNKNDKRVDNS